MSNLELTPGWPNIPAWNEMTPAVGTTMNAPAHALGSRTEFLKKNHENLFLDLTEPKVAEYPIVTFTSYEQLALYEGDATHMRFVDLAPYAQPVIAGDIVRTNSGKVANGGFVFKDALNRTWERRGFNYAHLSWWRPDRTGVSDSSDQVQAALAATRLQGGSPLKLLWNSGKYKITKTQVVGSNQIVDFESSVEIDFFYPDPSAPQQLFVASGQRNVHFDFNGAVIRGNRGVYAEGNGLHIGFFLYGTKNFSVKNAVFEDFGVDGIVLEGDDGVTGPCMSGIVFDCVCRLNGRNGLSVTNAKGVVIELGLYEENGFAVDGPCAGIDIEPNYNSYCEGVVVKAVRTRNNSWAGIQVTPNALSLTPGRACTVSIEDCTGDGDGTVGRQGLTGGLVLSCGGPGVHKIPGYVKVKNYCTTNNPSVGGVLWNWEAAKMPRIMVDGFTSVNPGSDGDALLNYDRAGFLVRASFGGGVARCGNVTFNNIETIDTRATKKATSNLFIDGTVGDVPELIEVNNPDSNINPMQGAGGVVIADGVTVSNFKIKHKNHFVEIGSTPLDMRIISGISIVSTANFGLFNLPQCISGLGIEIELLAPFGTSACEVRPSETDAIIGVSNAGEAVNITAGGHLRIKATVMGWVVLSKERVALA